MVGAPVLLKARLTANVLERLNPRLPAATGRSGRGQVGTSTGYLAHDLNTQRYGGKVLRQELAFDFGRVPNV